MNSLGEGYMDGWDVVLPVNRNVLYSTLRVKKSSGNPKQEWRDTINMAYIKALYFTWETNMIY